MGIFDLIKRQFIDVIEWNEEVDGVLSYRFPMIAHEIQNGAKLTVRDTQVALFVNEGEVADILEPGLHTLNTHTLPMLTSLKNWDKFFTSPFKSDVYFFSTREQINQRFGTPNGVTIRDKDLGPLRLRAHGTYSYRIKNPKVFFKKISGTRELYTTHDLEGQLRSVIVTAMASFFGNAEVSFLDMAANQSKFSETLKEAFSLPFDQYGLALETFLVESISLPEEVQEHLDKASSMRVMGDFRKYAQFQAADSISIAAANPGGIAGAGASLGMVIAMGHSLDQSMTDALGVSSASSNDPNSDPLAMIGKLHELLTKGILSQSEFDAKKSELLKKI